MNWISVDEALPTLKLIDDINHIEESDPVLIYDKNKGYMIGIYKIYKEYENRPGNCYKWEENMHRCSCCEENAQPIYWMPLPEKPL